MYFANLLFALSLCSANIVLDQPPLAKQLDYAPADNATVSVNPPPFIWPPPEKDLRYVLELARDSAFAGESLLRFENITLSTYALEKALAPGQWYWRYGVELEDKQVLFSKARAFSVSDNTPSFPFPKMDACIAAVPQTHPRIFFHQEEIEGYRKRAASGDLSSFPASFAKGHDKHLGADIVAEPPYVTGKGPERGLNYAKIFRSTRPDMNLMEDFALAWILTGDLRYGEEAKRRILHFFAWDPEGSTEYKHNDEPAMWVMMRGIRAYDWTWERFSEEERAQVEKAMRVRAQQFYLHLKDRRRFHSDPFESHAGRTIGFLGEAALVFAHEWPESKDWLQYVLLNFWNVYPAWGKEDGGWHEGPSYYSAYMSFALHFITALKSATGIDLCQKPFFQNTPNYLLYTNPPYAKISPFGDGEHGGASGGRGVVMYAFSSLMQNPYARWYAETQGLAESNNLLGVVLRDNALKSKSPEVLPQAHYFPGIGLVSLHTALGNAQEDIHFLIHSDPYGAISHAHADQNAFTLEAFGEALAIASGFYPWYGSDHHRNWQWHSRSSNTITFDGGKGQKTRSSLSRGEILGFEANERYDYVVADASEAYPGDLNRFHRHVLHLRPGVFLIVDDIEAVSARSLEWPLHAWEKMTLDEQAQRVTITRGKARLQVDFLHPPALHFAQTNQLEYPPEQGGKEQYHFVASTDEPLQSAQFITLLTPYKEGREDSGLSATLQKQEDAWRVTVTKEGKKQAITIKKTDAGFQLLPPF